MKKHKILILIFCSCHALTALAQKPDTLKLNLPQAEQILIDNNLGLLAGRLNMDKAEAEKIQAKVWPNPTLSIEQFNPYVTAYQKRHAEKQASLFGSENFGQYRQVEVQLEQVFNLAGKRKKKKAIADVSSQQAEAFLADFLFDLKTEFRKTIIELTYHQQYLNILYQQTASLQTLIDAYKKQYKAGHVNKMELVRLQSSEMNLKDEMIAVKNELSHLQAELIVAMNLPENTHLTFTAIFDSDYNYRHFDYDLDDLMQKALDHRTDIRLSELNKSKAEKEYNYEKSLRVPDLGVVVNYDRGGGIYPDFIGIGVSMDLPFSNSNKGNIKKAKLNIQQQDYVYQAHLLKVKTEVRKKYERILHLTDFFKNIDNDEIKDLDRMMDAYTEYFRNRDINITTYMDFMSAYISNKQAILENQKAFLEAVEDLKYATGIDSLIP